MAEGTRARVTDVLPNGLYRVEREAGGKVDVHLAGKMRMNLVRLIPGDRVLIETSPFDARKARIVGRWSD